MSPSHSAGTGHRDAIASHTLPSDSNQINALRLDALRSSSLNKGLSQESMAIISHPRLVASATNRDLTNFLSHLHRTRGYQVGTLKLIRATVTHLHHSPATIRQQSDNPVESLLDSLASQAPPRPQYTPAVDLSKALKFLAEIPSSTTTAFSPLQGKVAFLMGMAAFLRPSDLQRIDLLSCVIDSSGILSSNVVAPKERRKKQRIIKQLTIHPHAANASLCPVVAFLALHDHHRLQRDIITLGNWTSSTTFENHYKRHSAIRTDFTTAVLGDIPISMDSDTDDCFEDALYDFRS
ncbi:hypothetical protein EDC96DRAFT_550176 [Choanephora cucurbitarum]|nr:hypothetical protein EDC96DRAFT_550176 [Choanephora cucurbitarum]